METAEGFLKKLEAREMAQGVKCLPIKLENLGLDLYHSGKKPGIDRWAYNLGVAEEAGTGGSLGLAGHKPKRETGQWAQDTVRDAIWRE